MKILKSILLAQFLFCSILLTTPNPTLAIDQVRSSYNLLFVSESFPGYSKGFGLASADYELLRNIWNMSSTFDLFAHAKIHYTRFNSQNKILTASSARFATSLGLTLQMSLIPSLLYTSFALSPGVHISSGQRNQHGSNFSLQIPAGISFFFLKNIGLNLTFNYHIVRHSYFTLGLGPSLKF